MPVISIEIDDEGILRDLDTGGANMLEVQSAAVALGSALGAMHVNLYGPKYGRKLTVDFLQSVQDLVDLHIAEKEMF